MDTQTLNIDTIGFFLLHRLPNQSEQPGYIGALFVTDSEGIPLEFKCTEAIRPTPVQQSLYGEKMEPYIAIKLFALPLLRVITNKPRILFVNEQSFLKIREEKEVPTLFIQQADNNITEVEQSPIILMPHPKYEADKNNEHIRESCHFNLTEPFDRIKRAVAILGEKDERFR